MKSWIIVATPRGEKSAPSLTGMVCEPGASSASNTETPAGPTVQPPQATVDDRRGCRAQTAPEVWRVLRSQHAVVDRCLLERDLWHVRVSFRSRTQTLGMKVTCRLYESQR